MPHTAEQEAEFKRLFAGRRRRQIVLGALIFSFRNWRCPACDKYLGKAMNPRFCSKCGVALR